MSDQPQRNVFVVLCSIVHFLNVLSKSVHNFLSYVVKRGAQKHPLCGRNNTCFFCLFFGLSQEVFEASSVNHSERKPYPIIEKTFQDLRRS